LVSRFTRMRVFEIEDGMAVEPDCTYIIPPNHDLSFRAGFLHLHAPSAPRGQRNPVDYFFRSLAEELESRAIAIVLSGTGSDGTQGVRAIKAGNGMVMAQDSESTQYDGMPRSAIATGMVDFVLPPAEMPAQLQAYVVHAFGKGKGAAMSSGLRMDETLKKIFVMLRAQTGHDFSQYKASTVNRRVERRMAVHQITEVDEYLRYLRKNPADVEALFRDLLIGVTHFFRDADAFKALEEEAIVRLLSNKAPGESVRIWVPGCSTGEEAYSIAILLLERMEALKTSLKLMVFATDLDSRAIEHARAGIYSGNLAAEISEERLKRFFTADGEAGIFRINKVVRDILVFSEHDLIKDPPFSRLDLISCRNLLIYMNANLHRELIPLFHYALNPGGFLFLGTSESVGDHIGMFTALNRTAKLYQRKDDGAPRRLSISRFPLMTSRTPSGPRGGGRAATESGSQLRELTERTLLQQYSAAGILVNEHGDILYLHGRTGLYLEPAPGEAALNVLKMARQGLRPLLSSGLHKVAASREAQSHVGVRVKTNGDFSTVNLKIRPVSTVAGEQALFLVILEAAADNSTIHAEAGEIEKVGGERASDISAHVVALKQELRDKEEYLQSTTEELETSNEELKSANEEMQSINEEMQSTNEELETSKEELQSVNEELATVNAELQGKVSDLSQANNDMNNLLAGTGVGTIFVNHQLLIQRFTPAVTQVISLIATDVGRPVGHIAPNLVGYSRLVEDVQQVLDTLIPKEIEVQTKQAKWFLLRIRPYRTLENVIDGAVITFFDISEMKRARELMQESETLRRLAALMTDSRDAIIVQSLDGKILAWNPGAVRLFGWNESEALQMNVRELIPEAGRDQALAIVHQLSNAAILQPYHMERVAKDGRIVNVSLTATALVNESASAYAIATTERADQ
jgi:two-component system CheB/CheR fusion protein